MLREGTHGPGQLFPREAPFTKESVVLGIATVISPAIARLLWKFLSLKMTVGVISCPREISSPPVCINAVDAFNQRIQDELVFRVEFVNHERVSAGVPYSFYR